MKIGIDVDGCLAAFNGPYVDRIIALHGDRFGEARHGAGFPAVWDYPAEYGYTEHEIGQVWKRIRKDQLFWATLDPLPGAVEAIRRLELARLLGYDIYFITARPGLFAKFQTEGWLVDHGMTCPTVLMTADKHTATRLLDLDVYIDDRLSNANMVMREVRLGRMGTRVYLQDAPYNRRPVALMTADAVGVAADERDPALIVVGSVGEMLAKEGL